MKYVKCWELVIAFIVGTITGVLPNFHGPHIYIHMILNGFVVVLLTWFILSMWRGRGTSKKKERFGRWFIKNYWKDILIWMLVSVIAIGYVIYVFFIARWGYENNLGMIITQALILAPFILSFIAIGLLSAYNNFKRITR